MLEKWFEKNIKGYFGNQNLFQIATSIKKTIPFIWFALTNKLQTNPRLDKFLWLTKFN